MALYFRKSKQVIPGLRVNLSKTGVGLSVGSRKTGRFTLSPNGKIVGSISLPGTGLRYSEKIKSANNTNKPSVSSDLFSMVEGLLIFFISLIKLIFVLGFLALIIWFCVITVTS